MPLLRKVDKTHGIAIEIVINHTHNKKCKDVAKLTIAFCLIDFYLPTYLPTYLTTYLPTYLPDTGS